MVKEKKKVKKQVGEDLLKNDLLKINLLKINLLKIDLLWHQKEDLKKILTLYDKQDKNNQRKAVFLANPTGMGKTVVACAVANEIKKESNLILIVCPAKLKLQWQERVQEYLGTQQERPFYFSVFSYNDLSDPGTRQLLNKNRFDLLIIDEAHYAKDFQSNRTQHLYGPAGVAHSADRLLCLSATPFKNRVGEIYPFLFAINAPIVKDISYIDFIKRYAGEYKEFDLSRINKKFHFNPKYSKKIINHKGVSPLIFELKNGMQDILIKRDKKDMAGQLPIRNDIPIECSAKMIKEENKLLKELLSIAGRNDLEIDLFTKDYESFSSLISALPSFTEYVNYKKQIGLLKIPAVMEYLTQSVIEEKEKFMLLTYFKDTAKKYLDELTKKKIKNIIYVDGSTPIKKRHQIIKEANEKKECVFIATMPSIAEGIDFLGFDSQYITELDWSIDLHTQVEGRIDRIGQTSTPYYCYFRLLKGVEKMVYRALCEKKETIKILMG